jgi:hypothetical protein
MDRVKKTIIKRYPNAGGRISSPERAERLIEIYDLMKALNGDQTDTASALSVVKQEADSDDDCGIAAEATSSAVRRRPMVKSIIRGRRRAEFDFSIDSRVALEKWYDLSAQVVLSTFYRTTAMSPLQLELLVLELYRKAFGASANDMTNIQLEAVSLSAKASNNRSSDSNSNFSRR